MRIVPLALAGSLALFATAVATRSSQAAAPARGNVAAVMHARHEGMEVIGRNSKTLHRELDGNSPNIATIRASAAQLAGLARQASGWFPVGTGPNVGRTGAKLEIWRPENRADFARKLAAFQRSAQTMRAMTTGNDIDGMRAAYADLGGTCKACHDKYRTEMHH
jgi:cytochrome c556